MPRQPSYLDRILGTSTPSKSRNKSKSRAKKNARVEMLERREMLAADLEFTVSDQLISQPDEVHQRTQAISDLYDELYMTDEEDSTRKPEQIRRDIEKLIIKSKQEASKSSSTSSSSFVGPTYSLLSSGSGSGSSSGSGGGSGSGSGGVPEIYFSGGTSTLGEPLSNSGTGVWEVVRSSVSGGNNGSLTLTMNMSGDATSDDVRIEWNGVEVTSFSGTQFTVISTAPGSDFLTIVPKADALVETPNPEHLEISLVSSSNYTEGPYSEPPDADIYEGSYTAAVVDQTEDWQPSPYIPIRNGCDCDLTNGMASQVVLSFKVNVSASSYISDSLTMSVVFGNVIATPKTLSFPANGQPEDYELTFSFTFDRSAVSAASSADYTWTIVSSDTSSPKTGVYQREDTPKSGYGNVFLGIEGVSSTKVPTLSDSDNGGRFTLGNNTYFFPKLAGGSYDSAPGSFATLDSVSGGYQVLTRENELFEFDSGGYATTSTDAKGRVTTYTYTTIGGDKYISSIESPFETTDYTYTGTLMTNVSSSLGHSVDLAYSGGKLVTATEDDPDDTGPLAAPVTTYAYNGDDRVSTVTDSGRVTTYTYDATGHFSSVENPDGSETGMVSSQASVIASGDLGESFTNNQGVTTTYLLDTLGNVTEEEDELGNVTIYERDANGLLLKLTLPDPDGAGPLESPVYEYTYDSRGNMLTETLPDDSVRTWVYHATWNQPTKYTDANGHITLYTYESTYEWLLTESKVLGEIDDLVNLETDDLTTTYSYTPSPTSSTDPPIGLVDSVTAPDGVITEFEYNSIGRLLTTTYAVGTADEANTSSTYCACGGLLSDTDELGNTTTYTRDDLSRVTTVTQPDTDGAGPLSATVTTYTYNAEGLLASEDVNGRTTSYTYNTDGQLTKVTEEDPDGAGPLSAPETTYTYHTDGNVATITDPLGNVTTYTYTGGLLTSVTEPDPDGAGGQSAPVTSYTYDAMGRTLTMTDPLGNVTTYAYDNIGRQTSVTMPDPDGAGSLTSLVSTTVYDAFDRIISLTDFDGTTTSFTYDSEGNKLTETTALGTTTYTYDELNRVETITTADPDGAGTLTALVTTYAYTVGGQLESVTTPKGTTTYTYDERRRRTSTTLPDPDGAGGQSAPVTHTMYDDAGNVLSETDTIGYTTEYEYDALNRVTKTTRGIPPAIDLDDYTVGDYAVASKTSAGSSYTIEDDGATINLQGDIWRKIDLPYTVTADTILEFDYESDTEGDLQGIGFYSGTQLGNTHFFQLYGTGSWGNSSFGDDYDPGVSTVKHYRIRVGDFFTGENDYLVFVNDHNTAPKDAESIFSNIKVYEANSVTYEYNEFGELVAQTDPNHGTTAYEYDDLGRNTKTIYADPDGAAALTSPEVSYVYDAAGQMTEMIDELGNSTTYDYDNLGRQISVTLPDPDGGGTLTAPVTTYSYDAASQLLNMTDPLGNTTSYTYDDMGRKLTETLPDPDGGGSLTEPVTTYTYNAKGQLESVTDAESQTVSYTYNSAGLIQTMTDPRGTTVYAYDALGRQIAMYEPDPDGVGSQLAPITLNRYNNQGELEAVITRDGKTSYTYDNLGRLVSVTQADPDDIGLGVGSSIGSGPGATGSASGGPEIVVTDGVLLGQVLTDGSSTVSFGTVDVGHSALRTFEITNIGDSLLTISSLTLPSDFRIISYSDAEVAAGESTTITIQFTPTSVASYSVTLTINNDDIDESTFEIQLTGTGQASTNGSELAASMTYTYDAVGRRTSETDALGNSTSYAYDGLGRVTTKTDAEGGETTYTYDANGNRLTLTDPEDNTTTWTFDALNRMLTNTNELSDTRYYKYDAAGNVTQYTDRNGRQTRYFYDDLQRLTTEQWKDGTTLVRAFAYKYDAASRLTEASDPAATYTFTYDNLGRNTSTEHDLAALGFDVVVDEAYDALGRRTSLAAELDGTDDLINSYAYDYQNRMTQVTQGSQSGGNAVAEKRVDFSYDAEDKSQFTGITRYADLSGTELVATSTYGYDAADRITSLTHTDGSSSTLAGYTWGYDERNRLTDFTVAGYSAEDATYTYDDTDQLTGADRSGTTSDESYSYDENGNRTGGSYTTGDNNQILSDGTYNYTYDDEGNRLTKTNISTGEVIEYTWDYRNRLVNITTKTSGGTVTHEVDYSYDIFNRRIGKTIDADGAGAGTATEDVYIYDGLREERGAAGDHILLAFDESDDLTDRFLYGPNVDQVLASEEVTSTASAGDTLWALTDHLGTVRDVADYNAGTDTTTVQNHLAYDSFGNITGETNSAVDFLFAFTGRERDEESDLQYNRARYYDAAIGKWLSEDPLGFAATDENLYRYVANQPISLTDPSGLQDWANGKGHHPIPKKVIRELKASFSRAAFNFLMKASLDPGYRHGNDTWNTVTHPMYNTSVSALARAYKDGYCNGGPISETEAQHFIDFLLNKKGSESFEKLSETKELRDHLSRVRKYLKGFYKSIVLAEFIKEIGGEFDNKTTKDIIRKIVNDGMRPEDIDELKPLLSKIKTLDKVARLAKLTRALKAAGPAVSAIITLITIQDSVNAAIKCEGPLGERIEGMQVELRIVHQIGYDAMFGDVVEEYILYPAGRSWADFLDNLFGGANNGKWGRRIKDQMRLLD